MANEGRIGAVALLDILGAKELFKRVGAEQYVESLKTIAGRVDAQRAMSLALGSTVPVSHDFAFFSDTLLLCAKDDGGATPVQLLDVVTALVASAIHGALQFNRPLTYRGCVALGDVIVEGPFFAGAAVNEAAELYEKAEVGAVWLAPSALQHSEPSFRRFAWSVPLKGGHSVETHVVNPLLHTWDGASPPFRLRQEEQSLRERATRVEEMREAILHSFDTGRLDTLIKKQHTEPLLRRAITMLADADEERAAGL